MKLCIFLLLSLCAISSLTAENLIFNGSFELDKAGFADVKYLNPDTNKELNYGKVFADQNSFISGKASLCISDSFAEEMHIYSKEFKLEAENSYKLTLWMKSQAKGNKVHIIVLSVGREWKAYKETFVLSEDWKEYSFNFKTDPDKSYEFYTILIQYNRETDASPGNLWLDNLSLNDVNTTNSNAPDIEASIETEKLHKLDGDKAPVTFTLRTINNSPKSLEVPLKIELIEDYTGKIISALKLSQKINSGDATSHKFAVPLQYGAYRIKVESEDKSISFNSMDGFTACIPYSDAPSEMVDMDKTFAVGLNYGFGMRLKGMVSPEKPAVEAKGTSPDESLALFQDMGCRIIRDWDGGLPALSLGNIQQKEGVYDFSRAETLLNLYEKHKIRLLPVLGGADFIKSKGNGWPEWLMKQSRKQEPDAPNVMKQARGLVYHPPFEIWKEYIRQAAAFGKGRISHYEIMNEPNLYLSPEDYLKYLSCAYTEIKKADTEAKVVAFCVTGDLGGRITEFMTPCLEKGGLDYADILSFHPYNARELSSPVSSDAQIKSLRDMMQKYAKREVPVWNTELYYLHGLEHDTQNAAAYDPHHAAKRFLTDLGEGVKQSIDVPGGSVWTSILLPHFQNDGVKRCQHLPSSNFVVYNALSRLFEGSRPFEKVKLGEKTIAYVYERNNEYTAAIWNLGEDLETSFRLKFPENSVDYYDVLGNKITTNTEILNLSKAPVYIRLKKPSFLYRLISKTMSQEDFIRTIRNAEKIK